MANEDKSTRYHRLRRRAWLAGTALQGLFLAGLILTGASVAIRRTAEAVADGGLVPVVVIYVCVVASLHAVLLTPVAFYGGVLLERRYGLSRERASDWWLAQINAGAVVLLGLVAVALAVSAILRWTGDLWWMVAAVGFSLTLVLAAQVLPALLAARSRDVQPLASPSLRARIVALAVRAGAPVVDVLEWRVGGRTKKANAVLVGVGRTRRILISDTLLAAHTEDEVEAVVAHELAHHVYGDVWSAMAVDVAIVALACYLSDRVLASAAGLGGLEGKTDVAGLPLLVLTGGVTSLALMPVVNALSRAHERRADRFALEMTGNSAALISAMRRLAAANLAEDRPSRLVELFFHTHPPVAGRIAAARQWAPGSRP